ncbi:MAG: PTS glucose transporter subunit IIA [Streptococcaceae bacterium]|jgi:PTS system beta-glucosides-specific IIA component|nr:PTS glucose transporter subunit IIA [Streptococcaceae bacterium]
MFGFGKKKKELKDDKTLYAPLAGQVLKIEETSDPVFSQKIMGDGYAVEPTDGKIFAPVSGTITMVQGHALGFTRADGLEVLLHVGIDTVSLNGAPFNFTVKVDDVVDGGEEVGSVDLAAVEAAGLAKTTMVVFTNTADKLADFTLNYESVDGGATIGSANTK